jgi:hypothetical protein
MEFIVEWERMYFDTRPTLPLIAHCILGTMALLIRVPINNGVLIPLS